MVSLPRTSIVLLQCLLILFAAGCPCGRMNRHLPGEQCDENSDCEDKRCDPVHKVCVQACKADADCIWGGPCRDGFCVPPSSPIWECSVREQLGPRNKGLVLLGFLCHPVQAAQQFSIRRSVQVHRAALTVVILLAMPTPPLLRPRTVTKVLIPRLPYVLEPLPPDVSLQKRIAQLGTSTNAPISSYARDCDPRPALAEGRAERSLRNDFPQTLLRRTREQE